ncbi:DUF3987 domain-containing protein [Aureimonas sp. Leaf454]|uniref:DUF3987 domain-containing protein n=1 Tax=Aureimonas sp. Leaf454 TaxID=1736381 RepID=UPI00138F1E53|nr:DUF3987 domain-containing protein [Aureimonas sp. Leaf454]
MDVFADAFYTNAARGGGLVKVVPEGLAFEAITRDCLLPAGVDPASGDEAKRWCILFEEIAECDAATTIVLFLDHESGEMVMQAIAGPSCDYDVAMRIIARAIEAKPLSTEPVRVRPVMPRTTAANDNESDPVDPWARAKHPPLPDGLLPPVLERFAKVKAETMGVDPGGVAAATLAVCAAAIPDDIKIQVKKHDKSWTESARIWVALIGQPSAKKSPIISAASAPLKEIDDELYREYARATAVYEALSKEEKKSAVRPFRRYMRMEDTTIESAQEMLRDSPDGVLCLQDELSGWFGSMEKYASGKGSAKDRGFWLQSFNGGSHVVSRVGRGNFHIDNLSISLLGGIQPEPIRKIAADMQDDGLLQRLFPIVMGTASVGTDAPAPPVVAEYAALVRRLNAIEKPKAGMVEVPLRFDEGGQAIRAELEVKHQALAAAWQDVNLKLSAHFGKYDGLFARLCVLWHCVESAGARPASVVEEDTARRVAAFLHDFLRPHAIAFYTGILGLSDNPDALLATAGYILSRGLETVTARDVCRGDRIMRLGKTQAAERALEQLDALGWVVPIPTLRRDSTAYNVVPRVHTLFAERAAEEERRRSEVRELIKLSVAA